jgi:hypothetical protein
MTAISAVRRTIVCLFPLIDLANAPANFVSRKNDKERIKTIMNPMRLFQLTVDIFFKSRENDEFFTMSSKAKVIRTNARRMKINGIKRYT